MVWAVVERRARRGRRIEGGREVGVLVVCRMQRDTVRVVILLVVIDGSSSLRRLEYWDTLMTGRTACQARISADIRVTKHYLRCTNHLNRS